MVQRIGWIFTTNQQTQNDPLTPNQPRHCLKNIPFSLLQKEYIPLPRIKMSKKNAIKNWKKKTLLIQKYLKSLGEASILKAKKITLEVLRQPKTAKNEDIIPFTTIYNTSNSNVFPIINQSFNNFQYFKTMSNVFQKKKLVNSMSQAPNLGRLLCKPVGCNLSTLSLIYIYIYIYITTRAAEWKCGSRFQYKYFKYFALCHELLLDLVIFLSRTLSKLSCALYYCLILK